jgi:hypothetical protein
MEFLRTTAKWHLQYDYQFIQTKSFVSILSLNTHILHAHMDDILNDYDTMQSDIFFFQETSMALCMQNKQFPNHNCISSYITHGVMILMKKHAKNMYQQRQYLDHIHLGKSKKIMLRWCLQKYFSMGQKLQY